MMSSSLSSWQSANNFRREGDVVYGVYQGCGFSVSEEDGGKLFIFMLSANDNRAFDTFENALAGEGGELSQGQIGDVENYLAVFYDESVSSVSLRTMDKLLDFVVAEARSCGFHVPNTCVKCGARANKRSFVDNMVQPLCAECSAKQKQNRRPAPSAPAPKPMASRDEDDYERRYAPMKPDSSKYDDSYDEYSGMKSKYDDDRYSDKYGGTYNDADYAEPPVSFDDSGDEYRAVMGDDRSDKDDSPTREIEGTVGRGILGAALGVHRRHTLSDRFHDSRFPHGRALFPGRNAGGGVLYHASRRPLQGRGNGHLHVGERDYFRDLHVLRHGVLLCQRYDGFCGRLQLSHG